MAELEFADDFGSNGDNFAIRLQYAFSEADLLDQNVVGVNAEATFGKFGIFGRYGISIDPTVRGAVNTPLFANDNNVQNLDGRYQYRGSNCSRFHAVLCCGSAMDYSSSKYT
ncbi:MAG: hypothetical protein HC810_03950 [Acaryochloridaceae cyanobacterium RL_2_7]|nr:hypothetical protein [Acaryochloridaceae cyanobacterium RL_2_7]